MGDGWRGSREKGRKGYRGVKRREVGSIYTYEGSIMKPTKHFERGGGGRGRMGIYWRR
jgi:hypothetical protein